MSPRDNQPTVKPIESPGGLDLHPEPDAPARVSRKALIVVMGVVLALLACYAYGGIRRTAKDEAIARQAGLPGSVAPATQAGAEFVNSVPVGVAPLKGRAELQPPPEARPTATPPCGVDQRTGTPNRYDPQTGQPCEADRQDRAVVRQAVRPAQPTLIAQTKEPTPEEQAAAQAFQREREAMLAPTTTGASRPVNAPTADVPSPDLAQIVTRIQSSNPVVRNPPPASGPGLPTQPPFDTRLRSSRVPPLSPYEIKAGWEIPAILEQSLNSDLPGELKALVASNVYDTATGVYVLIPQGSRLIGRYDSRISYGQDGVQVAWDRIIFPDASTINLNGMAGLDTHGNAGLRDQVDRHYRRLIGFSMLTSMFNAGFALSQQRNQSVLVNPSAGQIAASAVGQEVSQTGAEITRRNLNVQPTIKVPAGYRFTVRANRDILFEAPYEALDPVLGQAGR